MRLHSSIQKQNRRFGILQNLRRPPTATEIAVRLVTPVWFEYRRTRRIRYLLVLSIDRLHLYYRYVCGRARISLSDHKRTYYVLVYPVCVQQNPEPRTPHFEWITLYAGCMLFSFLKIQIKNLGSLVRPAASQQGLFATACAHLISKHLRPAPGWIQECITLPQHARTPTQARGTHLYSTV